MSSVWGMILQWGSTKKLSIELPVATRHRRDMTEKLVKATLNSNIHTLTVEEGQYVGDFFFPSTFFSWFLRVSRHKHFFMSPTQNSVRFSFLEDYYHYVNNRWQQHLFSNHHKGNECANKTLKTVRNSCFFAMRSNEWHKNILKCWFVVLLATHWTSESVSN